MLENFRMLPSLFLRNNYRIEGFPANFRTEIFNICCAVWVIRCAVAHFDDSKIQWPKLEQQSARDLTDFEQVLTVELSCLRQNQN
jgi:hypothetical protein